MKLINKIMLENVNAINVNAENVLQSLVFTFGDVAVQTCDEGVIKLNVKSLGNGDLLAVSNLIQFADIQIKRSSNGGLLILFIPKMYSGPYSQELQQSIEMITQRD